MKDIFGLLQQFFISFQIIMIMNDEKKLERVLNILLKKKYPFIKNIDVFKIRVHFSDLIADINIFIDFDFLQKHVKLDCYDSLLNDDTIFFSLWSYNYCSDEEGKIPEKEMEETITSLYKMLSLNDWERIYQSNISISVLVENPNFKER